MKMPPQIVRLLLLTLGIVGSYLVARHFLTPPSFGQYGWYRADAMELLASRTPVFAGKKACDECHSDVLKKLASGPHKTLSCEACHGVSSEHAQNPDIKAGESREHPLGPDVRPAAAPDTAAKTGPAPVRLVGAHCIRCHEENPSRPAWFKQIVVKTHYSGKCTDCHVPHKPTDVP